MGRRRRWVGRSPGQRRAARRHDPAVCSRRSHDRIPVRPRGGRTGGAPPACRRHDPGAGARHDRGIGRGLPLLARRHAHPRARRRSGLRPCRRRLGHSHRRGGDRSPGHPPGRALAPALHDRRRHRRDAARRPGRPEHLGVRLEGRRCRSGRGRRSVRERLVRGPARPDRPRERRGHDVHRPAMQIAYPAISPDGARVAFVEGFCSDRGILAGETTVVPPATARRPCWPRSSTSAASRGGTSARCGSRPSPASARRVARSRSTARPRSSGAARHRSRRGGCRPSPRRPTAACSRPRTAPGPAHRSCGCSIPPRRRKAGGRSRR